MTAAAKAQAPGSVNPPAAPWPAAWRTRYSVLRSSKVSIAGSTFNASVVTVGDPRRRRSTPAPRHHPFDMIVVALHDRLDRAVAAIAHPAGDAQIIGGLPHRNAIADSLHATANDDPPRDHGINAGAAGHRAAVPRPFSRR